MLQEPPESVPWVARFPIMPPESGFVGVWTYRTIPKFEFVRRRHVAHVTEGTGRVYGTDSSFGCLEHPRCWSLQSEGNRPEGFWTAQGFTYALALRSRPYNRGWTSACTGLKRVAW